MVAKTGLKAFNPSGYEILDDQIAHGQLVIWSTVPLAPLVGDIFLVESGGRAYDATVEELVLFKGGWSATCRAERAV